MSENNDLLKLVNASGFAFQLCIENTIKDSEDRHSWKVISSEHRWKSPDTDNDGFIDIILSSPSHVDYRAVIECKRTKDANWIFLLTDKNKKLGISSVLLYTKVLQETSFAEYYDFSVNPASIDSSFCVIRGSDEKDKPMLERLTAHLIESVECLAIQELELYKNEYETMIFYFPIIVTNANLFTCSFDPQTVNIDTGMLESKNVDLKPVDFIKFRKTLPSKFDRYLNYDQHKDAINLSLINKADERTVFIVKSTAIVDFLRNCEITGRYPNLQSRINSIK
jgi:hypothetical protein